MFGIILNGLLLIGWLVIWATTGQLLLPAICVSAVATVLCALIAGVSA